MDTPHELPRSSGAALAQRRGRRWGALLVAAATLFALASRLAAVDVLLPFDAELHERVFLRHLERLEGLELARASDPDAGYYPELVPRLAALATARASARPEVDADAAAFDERADRIARLRRVCAWLSALVVPAVFCAGRRIFGARAGVLAALLAATSLMLASFGWQARPHGIGAALGACALAAMLEAQRRRSARWSVLAGLALGLALGNLQSAAALVPALAIAHVPWWRDERRRALAAFALALLAALAVALPLQPALRASDDAPARAFAAGASYVELAGHAVRLDAWHGRGVVMCFGTAWDYDPLLWLAAAAGVVLLGVNALTRRSAASSERRAALHTLAAFALPYALVVGAYDLSLPRFLLLLVPVGALLGGHALAALAGRARAALPALVLAASATVVVSYSLAQRRSDTEHELVGWLARHGGTIAVFPGASLLLGGANHGAPEIAASRLVRVPLFELDELERARRDPRAFVDALAADLVVVPVWSPERAVGRVRTLDRLREVLAARARRVERIVPWRDGTTLAPYMYDYPHCREVGPWWLAALRARCSGPAFEVFHRTEPQPLQARRSARG